MYIIHTYTIKGFSIFRIVKPCIVLYMLYECTTGSGPEGGRLVFYNRLLI